MASAPAMKRRGGGSSLAIVTSARQIEAYRELSTSLALDEPALAGRAR